MESMREAERVLRRGVPRFGSMALAQTVCVVPVPGAATFRPAPSFQRMQPTEPPLEEPPLAPDPVTIPGEDRPGPQPGTDQPEPPAPPEVGPDSPPVEMPDEPDG
jgi:hypothetical protein